VLNSVARRLSAVRLPKNRYLWTGYLAGGMVILLLVASSVLSRAHLGDKTIHAEFAQAAGLRRGDSVDVAGIAVGAVGNERIEGDHILVDLRIDHDVILGPDAHATIELSTILGKMHVVLTPGRHGSSDALPGHRITLAHTAVPYNLAKVVNDPRYTSQFEHIERLDPNLMRQALDTLAGQMGDKPQLTVDAINSMGALAKVIDQRADEVDSLLKNMDAVAKLVDDNRNGVLTLLMQGRAVGDAIAQRRQLLKDLLDNVASMSRQLQQMGVDNRGQLGPLIRNLDTMSQGLERNSANLDRLFQIAAPALRQFNNSLGNGPYGDIYVPWGLFPDNWLCAAQVVQGCK
jgi:virulence factor Mce-like protein